MIKTKIIAEIGINHNGDLELAKRLIDTASLFGCDYVKFQKRNPDKCVPHEQKQVMKDTPWGRMPYIDYKHKIEFGKAEFDEIDSYCKEKKIQWFASVWDKDSVDFMTQYDSIMKIPSALIIDHSLLKYARKHSKFLLLSTGMSTEEEVQEAIYWGNPDVIFHTNSTYPSPESELNLNYINRLKWKWPKKEIGYSGHEYGLTTTFAAVALGVSWVERHITLDRTMWGSDQMASLEPIGVYKLVKGIRGIEQAMGSSGPRQIGTGEELKRKTLRK